MQPAWILERIVPLVCLLLHRNRVITNTSVHWCDEYFFPIPHLSEEVHLRHVEKDVLIPKLMREKAKEQCADRVEGV